jgi:hypothetical protein
VHETRAERKKARSHTGSDDLSVTSTTSMPLTPTVSLTASYCDLGATTGGHVDTSCEGSDASSECSTAEHARENAVCGIGRSHMRNCSDATIISLASQEEEQAASSQKFLDECDQQAPVACCDEARARDAVAAHGGADEQAEAEAEAEAEEEEEAEAEAEAEVEGHVCHRMREVDLRGDA